MNDLVVQFFNIRTTFNSIFHCCWDDVELVMASNANLVVYGVWYFANVASDLFSPLWGAEEITVFLVSNL